MIGSVVVGISAFNHDASACVLTNRDGVVAFGEEERFTRQKHTGDFPSRALRSCLQRAGVSARDVSDIAFYFSLRACFRHYLRTISPAQIARRWSPQWRKRCYYQLLWLLQFRSQVRSLAALSGSSGAKIHCIDHHFAHAWYGFYASGLRDCVVLVNDSVGESVSSSAVKFQHTGNGSVHFEPLFLQRDPDSLGYMYGAVTEFLGFRRGDGEGTVMALAAYGTPSFKSLFEQSLILLPNGRFRFREGLVAPRSFAPRAQRLSSKLTNRLGEPRSPDEQLTQRHADIAYAVQHLTEVAVLHQARFCAASTDCLVLTGGVGMNSVVNGKVADELPSTKILVPPIPSDAGTSLGAAVYVDYLRRGRIVPYRDTAFLGEVFSTESIASMLSACRVNFRSLDRPVDSLVDILAAGEVIGLFRGAMECGPRALGKRSILANGGTPGMRDHLNSRVKYRDGFRPYGAIVRACSLRDVFDVTNEHGLGPYMSFVARVRREWTDRIPSLVHKDGTCRVQVLSADDLFLNEVLRAFEVKTGIPVLINTSLNMRGEPIARSPADSLAVFINSSLDHLLLNESLLVSK